MLLELLVFSEISIISTSIDLPLFYPTQLNINHTGFLGGRLEAGIAVRTGFLHNDVTVLTPISRQSSAGLIYTLSVIPQNDSLFSSRFFVSKSFGESYSFAEELKSPQKQDFFTEQRWNYWHDLWRSAFGVELEKKMGSSSFSLSFGLKHSTPWWFQRPGSGFDYSKVHLSASTIGFKQDLNSWAWKMELHHIHSVVSQTRISFLLPAFDLSWKL